MICDVQVGATTASGDLSGLRWLKTRPMRAFSYSSLFDLQMIGSDELIAATMTRVLELLGDEKWRKRKMKTVSDRST
jgi:hypothetical protein